MTRTLSDRRGAFTLVELLIVMAIIGVIVSLILVAASDGIRRAEERATQSLVTKVETALKDRLDALSNTTAPINQTHRYLAAINYAPNGSNGLVPVGTAYSNSDDRRAQVIAQKDFLRAEMPDVWFPTASTSDGAALAAYYPINFAAAPYPAGATSVDAYRLPLGNLSPGLPFVASGTGGVLAITQPPTPTTGMMGASFSAASGIYKQLGYAPTGYDGVDNNHNGYIDELAESGLTLDQVSARLATHTHNTARAEMAYALLVAGLSPLGSAFNPDDFTAREVGDTDGDGLLEFIDAWGQPLQIYRWPTYYGASGSVVVGGATDTQKGSAPYTGFAETRQIDVLDQNQLLVSPGWWSSAANPGLTSPAQSSFVAPGSGTPNQCSQGAMAFMHYFHSLVDPYAADTSHGTSWDRGGAFRRRSYYAQFLVLSGGPDREPGVAMLGKDYDGLGSTSGAHLYTFPNPQQTVEANALSLIYIENPAAQADPLGRTGSFAEVPLSSGSSPVSTFLTLDASTDDVSNQNIQAPTVGVR